MLLQTYKDEEYFFFIVMSKDFLNPYSAPRSTERQQLLTPRQGEKCYIVLQSEAEENLGRLYLGITRKISEQGNENYTEVS